VFEFQNDGDVAGTPVPGNYFGTFNNTGTVRRTAGAGNAYITGQINNQGGAWDIQTGSFTLGPTNGGTFADGTFKAAGGTSLDLLGYNGASTWTGKFTGSGAGLIGQASGTMTIGAAGATFNFPNYALQNGTVSGGGRLDFSGLMTYTGTSGGLSGADFHNNGTIIHNTASTLTLSAGAVFTNEPTGVFDFQGDGDIFESATNAGTVNNKGLIRKSGGTGVSYVRGIVNNQGGTWESQTGNLVMSSNGTHTGGTFNASAGGLLSLTDNRNATWTGNFTGSGAGNVYLSEGTMTIGAAGATLNFAPGLLNWYTGKVNGSGTLTNTGAITIASTAGNVYLSGLNFSNAGTIVQASKQNLIITAGTVLTNEVTGVFDYQADGNIDADYFNPASMVNKGLFKKSAGTGTSGFFFGSFSNSGTIDVQTGTIYLNTIPTVTFNGALRGNGSFAGPTVDNSSGQVLPGSSPGLLSINSYKQSGTGDLRIDLAGTTAGTQYDQLAVFGTVSLGGTLHVALGFVPAVNDTFTIINNDGTSDKVTGEFNSLPDGGTITVNGVSLQINYNGGDGNDVTLKAVSTAATAPPTVAVQINDGSAQRSMVTSMKVTFSQAVVLGGNPFTLTRTGPGSPAGNVTVAIDLSQSTANQTIAVLTFTGPYTNGKSLMDGRYDLTISAANVVGLGGQLDGNGNGTGGDNYTAVGAPGSGLNLFRLFGDANGDGTVAANDFLQFRLAYGIANATFDADGDGTVTAADFLQFRLRFGNVI
jgi:hypothetical protein